MGLSPTDSGVLLDEGGDVALRAGTDHLVHHDAVLVKEQGRDGVHAELLGQGLIGVDVDLRDQDGSIHLSRKLVEYGPDLFARTTPGGPEVHQDGDGGRLNGGVEVGVIEVEDEIGGHERDLTFGFDEEFQREEHHTH